MALAFNRSHGVVLAADLGATHARVAITDLMGTPLAERAGDVDIGLGPAAVLGWVSDQFVQLLAAVGSTPAGVRGIGIGVPGPVEFETGRPVSPPIMPGWDGFDIPRLFRRPATPRPCSSTTTSTSWPAASTRRAGAT